MTKSAGSYVVRKLADCIERLPGYINNPEKMPFVQKIVQRALYQLNFDREALALGHKTVVARGNEVGGQLSGGKKYRGEIGAGSIDTELHLQPVKVVLLSERDKSNLRIGFDDDETGIFELFERYAAWLSEWLKEHWHPRDAELFRSRFSYVCGEALLDAEGVEISPGIYKLDLGSWATEVAKPFCDELREIAEQMETVPDAPPKTGPSWDRIKGELSFKGEIIKTIRCVGVAKNIVLVLDTFEEMGWPERVDSPLPPANSKKHHATIDSLNQRLSLIQFRSDGEGTGFVWQTR